MVVIIFALAAIFAPVLAPHDPLLVDVSIKLKNPSAAYPLGTDQLGRCILSRLLWGSRYSLSYSFTVLLITVCVGVPIGLFAGYVGGKIDSMIMRIIDVFMAMPVFIVALAIAGTVGASGAHLILSLSVVSWAEYARLARALTLQEKNKNYMTALKAGGCGHARIIFRHVLRNILPSVIALATMEIGSIILSIAGFSFIGLGVQAPTPEWGIMLSDSKSYIQSITSGKSKPSTQELFNIADYFNMSLSEFFDEENVESPTVQKAIDAIRKLSEQDAALALAMIQRLSLPLREGGAEQ